MTRRPAAPARAPRVAEVALGLVTGIGGFLEAGSLVTAAQAGADFGYRLVWAVVVGTLILVVLIEMSGRLAVVSRRTLADAMRERFGMRYFVVPLAVGLALSLLTLASEVGGVALALAMATGIAFRWWALPVALLGWMLLWKGTFGVLEKGTALLGLVSVVFAVAALRQQPSWAQLAAGLRPTMPSQQPAHYWFLAVSIVGASASPYLLYFYSAGAIEERWDAADLATNRWTAALGNGFGGLLAVAVLVVAALAFRTRGIHVDRFERLGLLLSPTLGRGGFACLVATVGINCFGATLELALSCAYLLAQALGWDWSENAKPGEHARFSLVYTAAILVAAVPIVLGVDVLRLTNVSMALTAASLPFTIVPLLVLMNDPEYLRGQGNGWLGNAALGAISVVSLVLLVVTLPLQLLGG